MTDSDAPVLHSRFDLEHNPRDPQYAKLLAKARYKQDILHFTVYVLWKDDFTNQEWAYLQPAAPEAKLACQVGDVLEDYATEWSDKWNNFVNIATLCMFDDNLVWGDARTPQYLTNHNPFLEQGPLYNNLAAYTLAWRPSTADYLWIEGVCEGLSGKMLLPPGSNNDTDEIVSGPIIAIKTSLGALTLYMLLKYIRQAESKTIRHAYYHGPPDVAKRFIKIGFEPSDSKCNGEKFDTRFIASTDVWVRLCNLSNGDKLAGITTAFGKNWQLLQDQDVARRMNYQSLLRRPNLKRADFPAYKVTARSITPPPAATKSDVEMKTAPFSTTSIESGDAEMKTRPEPASASPISETHTTPTTEEEDVEMKSLPTRLQCEEAAAERLATQTEPLEEGNMIGWGSYGYVYEVCMQNEKTKCNYAMKLLSIDWNDSGALRQAMDEIRIQKKLSDSGLDLVPRVYDYWTCDNVHDRKKLIYILMEKMYGSLQTYMYESKTRFNAQDLARVKAQIDKLTRLGHVLHNDLHTGNILVGQKTCEVKDPKTGESSTMFCADINKIRIADFGKSKDLDLVTKTTFADAMNEHSVYGCYYVLLEGRYKDWDPIWFQDVLPWYRRDLKMTDSKNQKRPVMDVIFENLAFLNLYQFAMWVVVHLARTLPPLPIGPHGEERKFDRGLDFLEIPQDLRNAFQEACGDFHKQIKAEARKEQEAAVRRREDVAIKREEATVRKREDVIERKRQEAAELKKVAREKTATEAKTTAPMDVGQTDLHTWAARIEAEMETEEASETERKWVENVEAALETTVPESFAIPLLATLPYGPAKQQKRKKQRRRQDPYVFR